MGIESAYDAYLEAAAMLDAAAGDVERRGLGMGTASALRGEAGQMRQDLEAAPGGALDEMDRRYLLAVRDRAEEAALLVGVMTVPEGRTALSLEQEHDIMGSLRSAIRNAQTALRREGR